MENIEKIKNLKNKVRKYMGNYNVNFVKQYIKENCKEEYMNKLMGANLLCNNSFIYDDTWDMEQCNIPYLIEPLTWDTTPNGDEEWIFMLNRQEYLEKLIMAYFIEEDEKYIDKWKELVFNWIESNPIKSEGGRTIRTIDTGIRCHNWLYGLIHLINEDKLTNEEILKIVYSMKEQFDYLKNAYIDKYVLSNWGVLQTTAMASANLWLNEFFNDEVLFNWAEETLYKQIELQVFDDGSHWEQSVMYHVEVLNCSMKFYYMAEVCNHEVKDSFIEKIHNMARYLVHCATPGWKQVAQGDSDRTDVRDVLVKAVVLFKDGELKWCGFDNMDLSSIWFMGKTYYERYSKIKEEKPTVLNKSFEDSGNIFMRSDWTDESSFIYIKNGTLGSGHGHSDLGHFSLYYNGKPFMVDCGRYTYVEDDIMREYLKSAKAHNVSIIDDNPFAIPKKSWGYEKYPDTMKNYFRTKENISYAEIAYESWLTDGTPYVAKRKVLFIAPNIWIIVNDIRCKGEHNCKNYYNFDNKVKIENFKQYIQVTNEKKSIMIYNYKVDKKQIKNGYISKTYNEINNNKVLVTESSFCNKLIDYTIIIGENNRETIQIVDGTLYQYNNPVKVNDERAIVKEIIISNTESYVVIIFNEETYKGSKVYFYDNDIPVYGKVVIIHKKNNENKLIRLRV